MLKISLSVTLLLLELNLPISASFTVFGGTGGRVGGRAPGVRSEGCRAEAVTIDHSVCKIDWAEECSSERKKVGERVVYEMECKDREVTECKTIQMVYQDFPTLGIEGGPGAAYEECDQVTKNVCEEVPRKKDVTAEVETCVQTPREVCKEEKQRSQKYICERVKPGTEE